MPPLAVSEDETTGFPSILDEPEQESLLRLTKLVEHLFRVPVAYMALLGADLTVVTRIGSGSEYWSALRAEIQVSRAIAEPILWPRSQGELKFIATVPLRSSDGLALGGLAIADLRERPDFQEKELTALAELAEVLAGKMELRMLAAQSRDAELALREAERRFRSIADAAPVMIIYSGADGAASFVNRTWLDFTGRTFEEELGGGYAEMFHPDDRERMVQSYWEAFRTRKPLTAECVMQRRDGVYRRMQARGKPRLRDDGAFLGYIGCFVDVTEQTAPAGG